MGASFGFVFGIGGAALVTCRGLDEWDAGGADRSAAALPMALKALPR